MKEAPDKMWRETIWPCAQYREGGSFYHEDNPGDAKSYNRKELVEYTRADTHDALVKAADELAEAVIRTSFRTDGNGVTTIIGTDGLMPIWDALVAYKQAKEK